jgi:hypothetical protein
VSRSISLHKVGAAWGIGSWVRHEAGLVLELPVGTSHAPLSSTGQQIPVSLCKERDAYVDTAGTGVATEVVKTIGLAAGTFALHHSLGLAAVDATSDTRAGSGHFVWGATLAVGERLELVLGEVLGSFPLLAHIATDPWSG